MSRTEKVIHRQKQSGFFLAHPVLLLILGIVCCARPFVWRLYVVCPSDELVRDSFKQAENLPLAVVSIIRYPGKHDSASQESLLSLFGPPSLLANALKIDNCRFIVQRYNNIRNKCQRNSADDANGNLT